MWPSHHGRAVGLSSLSLDLALSAKSHASIRRNFLCDLTRITGVKLLVLQVMTAIRLAGDDDAIDAAKTDAAQAFKSTDLFKSLAVFGAIGLAIGLIGD